MPEKSCSSLKRPVACFGRLSMAFTALVLAVSVACGGGGGGSSAGSDTITVTKDKSVLTATAHYKQGQYTGSSLEAVPVTVTLTPVPSGNVYSEIVADKAGIAAGPTQVYHNADGTYTVFLLPDTALEAGTYEGTLTLKMYKDNARTQPYTLVGATLPFTITITPQLTMTVKVNDVPVLSNLTPLQTSNGIGIKSGDIVAIDSNLPATWMWSQGPGLVQVVPEPGSTTTAWRAAVSLDTPPYSNQVTLIGTAADGSHQSIAVTVVVSP